LTSADPPPYRRRVRGHFYHSPNQGRTGARQAARGGATGPAAVLALQRQVGNRAVRRTLARAPTLNESAPTGTYTAEAVKYFNEPANQAKGIAAFAQHLATKANEPLKALGVPEMKIDWAPGAPYPGAFWHNSWTLIMNTTIWAKSRGTKLSDMTVDEAADAAALIYHEARHAEQRFRVARMVAADSKAGTADKIADEITKALQIKERSVTLAAAGNPLAKTTANAALRDEAQDWREITFGRHAKYREAVNDWELELLQAMRTIDQIMTKPMEIDTARDKLAPTVKGWQASATRARFFPKHARTVKAIKTKSAGDKDVERNVTAIQAAMKKLSDEWAAIEKRWRRSSPNQKLTQIRDFKTNQLYALYLAVHTAYTEEAHEKDAYATGDPVKARFKAGVASAAKVPAGATP
jgi:hypothetical protein